MKHSFLYSFIFLSILLGGCEKDITLDLPVTEPLVVVEGNIELGQKPYVILTRSAPFFSNVDSATFFKTVITGATVTVTDGVTIDTLKQTIDLNLFPPIVYKGSKITGQIGKTYDLKIIAEGKTLTSTTSIPDTIRLDSIWFKLQPPNDSLGFIWAHLSDPGSQANYYRWYAKRIGKDQIFVPPNGSAIEDKFFNGKSFDFAYNRGVRFNSQAKDDLNEERGFFKKGDSIVVKFCTIGFETFKYYRSYQSAINSNGNPFAAPTNVLTNIKGGGQGCWAGFGVTYMGLRAKIKQ